MDDVTKPLPIYVQIAEGLIDKIESGDLHTGEQLPPERELSKTLGVTRVTLRQALQILEAEGLIERRQGAGTYIAEPKIERATTKLNPFTSGMSRTGYKPGAKVVLCDQRPASSTAAHRLKMPTSSPMYYYHRIRSLNTQPTMLEKFYLPVFLFPNFDKIDLHNASVFEQMKIHYGITIQRAEQSIEAVAASEYEAELLKMHTGAPLLLERRVSFDQHNRPVEYAKDLYRGDRIKFLLETTIE